MLDDVTYKILDMYDKRIIFLSKMRYRIGPFPTYLVDFKYPLETSRCFIGHEEKQAFHWVFGLDLVCCSGLFRAVPANKLEIVFYG